MVGNSRMNVDTLQGALSLLRRKHSAGMSEQGINEEGNIEVGVGGRFPDDTFFGGPMYGFT